MQRIRILFLTLITPWFLQGQEKTLSVYQNFDFIPGETILFEDDFSADMDGEFPAKWNLEGGQGVVNQIDSEQVCAVTVYYSSFSPRMKKKNYLPDDYTIEFDTWLDAAYDSNLGIGIAFHVNGEKVGQLETSNSQFVLHFPEGKLSADLPKSLANEQYFNKWHHISIAVKGAQMKVYCDQYRVLVVPDCHFNAEAISVTGDASEGMNMLFKRFKLASGGNMNLLGKQFTDSKIVTRGITFDVNKATIKPESMGTLNAIVKVMKENPTVKFEVGGHTDSDGTTEDNLTLSEKRANALRTQLIEMGIDATRLTAKGYGEGMPLNKNADSDEKAMNRRVEFTKI